MSPLQSFLQSRKFWLMIFDLVVSLTLYFVGKYAAPEVAGDIKYLIGVIQVPIIALIGAIAGEDAAAKAANGGSLPPVQ